jgi:4-amino-4-deoxy-L-arabinose transferase-like glycosyltransferase
MKRGYWIWPGMVLGIILAARLAGPSDLYDNDQPKTIAYTVDIVLHGHWAVPRDMLGRPATKPPMYNWIGVAGVWITGQWSEWVLKLPALVGGLTTFALTIAMGWYLARRLPDAGQFDAGASPPTHETEHDSLSMQLAAVAPALWLSCYASMKLIYTARPDMLLVGFLTIGWSAATVLMIEQALRPRLRLMLALILWLALGAATLTKGPAAVLLIIYLALAGRFVGGRWSAVHRTQWWWGLPLVALIVGGWLAAAERADPGYIRDILIGQETVDRVDGLDVEQVLIDPWKMPTYFMTMFAPWSIFAVLMLVHFRKHRAWRRALAPATLWMVIVVGVGMAGVVLLDRQRADYLAPAYPAAAVLAAAWLVGIGAKYRLTPGRVGGAAGAVALAVAIYYLTLSGAARDQYGEHVHRFVDAVERRVGDEGIRFQSVGYNPVPTLLGRNPVGRDGKNGPRDAVWLITPVDDVSDCDPVHVSQAIPEVGDDLREGRLGLYRLGPARRLLPADDDIQAR